MHPKIDLNEILRRATEMPPFSATTSRLVKLASNPNYDVADVVEVVKYDQALTLKLLAAANTVYYAGAVPAGTAYEAVMRLGTAQVMALAVASGVRSLLQAELPAYGMPGGYLWRHSIYAAVVGEIAPCYCEVESSPELFTAALLHDIGKLVMGHFIKGEILKRVVAVREAEGLSAIDAEARVIGIHHAQLGGLIAEHWKLPAGVVEGIRFHHDPIFGTKDICYFVYLADHVARKLGGAAGDTEAGQIPDDVASHLGLTEKKYEKLCEMAAMRYEKVSALYEAV